MVVELNFGLVEEVVVVPVHGRVGVEVGHHGHHLLHGLVEEEQQHGFCVMEELERHHVLHEGVEVELAVLAACWPLQYLPDFGQSRR